MVEHVLDDLPAYALGSLDHEESLRVAAHLEKCTQCQQELQAYRMVVDQLPIAPLQHTPPPELRKRILSQVAAASVGEASIPRPVGLLRRLSHFFDRPVPAWSLAGALVITLALIFGALFLYQQNLALAQKRDFQVVQLSGSQLASAASGWIVVTRDGAAGTLVVQNLPAIKTDQQYQLWLIRDGQRENGGVFSVDQAGYASLWVWSKKPLKDYQQFGITIEPAGGSPAPTGPKVLGGKF